MGRVFGRHSGVEHLLKWGTCGSANPYLSFLVHTLSPSTSSSSLLRLPVPVWQLYRLPIYVFINRTNFVSYLALYAVEFSVNFGRNFHWLFHFIWNCFWFYFDFSIIFWFYFLFSILFSIFNLISDFIFIFISDFWFTFNFIFRYYNFLFFFFYLFTFIFIVMQNVMEDLRILDTCLGKLQKVLEHVTCHVMS